MSPPLEVECYSGYTYAERPTAFVWRGRRYQVERILKRWQSPDGPGFRLVTTKGEQFELIYNQIQDEWSLHLSPSSGRDTSLPQRRTENDAQLCI